MRDFRTGLRPQTWIAVLLAAGIVSSSTPASAKVVCVTKKGGLVLRDGCKPNEVRLDADEAGLRGPKGDPGPPGPAAPPEQKPGPAKPSRGGGLEVLDAAGKVVGVVDSIGFYGGGARVVRDIGTDFFVFSVDKSGFQASDFGNFMFYYASPDCSGSRYLSNYYSSISPNRLAIDLFIDQDQKTAIFARGEEIVTQQFSFVGRVVDSSVNGAFLDCQRANGQPVGAPEPCFFEPDLFCLGCCQLQSGPTQAAPVRTLDLSPLKLTPPFRLTR